MWRDQIYIPEYKKFIVNKFHCSNFMCLIFFTLTHFFCLFLLLFTSSRSQFEKRNCTRSCLKMKRSLPLRKNKRNTERKDNDRYTHRIILPFLLNKYKSFLSSYILFFIPSFARRYLCKKKSNGKGEKLFIEINRIEEMERKSSQRKKICSQRNVKNTQAQLNNYFWNKNKKQR